MTDAATMIQQHAEAIVAALAASLDAPDPRAKLQAAKLLLRLGWGVPGDDHVGAVAPAGGIGDAELQRALDRLRPHLPSTTPRPAQHAGAPARRSRTSPRANPAINPMSPEPDAPAPGAETGAPRATTPCPAAAAAVPEVAPEPNPPIDPMSRDASPSPLAAPPGTNSPRGDADPMSRRVLPGRHSADDAFRRPLPQPPDIEPPWPFQPPDARPYRRQRWPPWR